MAVVIVFETIRPQRCMKVVYYGPDDGSGSVTHTAVVPYHTPQPTTHEDKHGKYDVVRCKYCGVLLEGSFV